MVAKYEWVDGRPTAQGIAYTEKEVAKFVKALDPKQRAALSELAKLGRDNAGWKAFGRVLIAAGV
jgi:hypothetical protein